MKVVKEAIEYVVNEDPILKAFVGTDANGDYKVYPLVAPKDTEPPWVVHQVIPGSAPDGHFGDLEAMQPVEVQFRCWGRTNMEAWDLFDAVDEAFHINEFDIELEPYNLMFVRRMGTPSEDLEIATGLFSVLSSFRFAVAR